MSYDIDLCDPVSGDVLQGETHQIKGGTYCLGGSTELHLNVTYNYVHHFRKALDSEKGIRVIYGMTGAESIPVLKKAISSLADDVSDDYWEATEGNARRALCGLLAFATMRPDGVWNGDD